MRKYELCNIPQAHNRILEAHRLVHQAIDNYFDPLGFRTNLNGAIQALRNVTFAIQNEKSKIEDFDNWYSKWVKELKDDEIMSWICNARTDIVHKKDLEIYSIATVTIYSYQTILTAKIDIPIFLDNKTVVDYLYKKGIIDENMRNLELYAKIERRWVVNDFPDRDVLYLISYGIGKLYNLISEAHQQTKIDITKCNIFDTNHDLRNDSNGMPQCMSMINTPLYENVGLKDYINRKFEITTVIINPLIQKDINKRYKRLIKTNQLSSLESPFDFANNLYEFSKKLLLKDGYHTNIIYYQTYDLKWKVLNIRFEDNTSKFMFWQEFAERVVIENIIAIISIGEVWIGKLDEFIKEEIKASEQQDRKEALMVQVISNEYKSKRYITIFTKNYFGKVSLQESIVEDIEVIDINDTDKHYGYLAPIIRAWNSKITK